MEQDEASRGDDSLPGIGDLKTFSQVRLSQTKCLRLKLLKYPAKSPEFGGSFPWYLVDTEATISLQDHCRAENNGGMVGGQDDQPNEY